MTNPIDRYGLAPRFLHWLTVILVLVAWTLGTFGDDLPKGAARDTGLSVHISAGLLILMALVVRLAWRVAEPPPPPEPNEFGRWLGLRRPGGAPCAIHALRVADCGSDRRHSCTVCARQRAAVVRARRNRVTLDTRSRLCA